jgi:uncharacterized membrane protein
MEVEDPGAAIKIQRHIRTRLISGLFVLVPLGITILIVRLLFGLVASVLNPLVALFLGPKFAGIAPVISVCTFVLLVYFVGVVTTRLMGQRMVGFGEKIIGRIPLVKSIYSASKQVIDLLSASNRQAFKSVVLIEFPRAGLRSIGFVTGVIQDPNGQPLYKVFVPHAPNPTTGYLELVPLEQLEETDLTVEEAIKMVVSGGMLSPDVIGGKSS